MPMHQMQQELNQQAQQWKTQGMNAMSFNVQLPPVPNVSAPSHAGPMILTVMTFLLGTGLLALGVWSSLDPSPHHAWGEPANGRAMKEPIAGTDSARL